MDKPRVLIMGHSFIRRLCDFIKNNAPEYELNFKINEPVSVGWRGIGGRTIAKMKRYDLAAVSQFRPDIVYLEIGTNDLTQRNASAVTIGSAIEDFVRLLYEEYGVRFVYVGQTINRDVRGNFNNNVAILARYLKVVLEPLPYAQYWTHRGFWQPRRSTLSYDGVHLNREGQHKLYKSIRGAVLHGLRRFKLSRQATP